MENVEIVDETKAADSFELVVTEKTQGSLITNIAAIEKFAEKRLKDYEPALYEGDSDKAKKDRAELNKATDILKRTRIDLINELMKPYEEFESRCKAVEKKIAKASANLDEIVKVKEQEEKNEKRKKIELQFATKNFDLVPLEKIFEEKWLNKTYKWNDICKEIDQAIDKIYKDLKLLDRFSDDLDLRAHYLMNLDISETLEYGEQIEKNRVLVQKEEADRPEREHKEAIENQKKELELEEKQVPISNLADEALAAAGHEIKQERKEFVISVKCFDAEMHDLKNILCELGIEYSVKELIF